ncbi:hypothetical protein D9M71_732050 [compost metagenome]
MEGVLIAEQVVDEPLYDVTSEATLELFPTMLVNDHTKVREGAEQTLIEQPIHVFNE